MIDEIKQIEDVPDFTEVLTNMSGVLKIKEDKQRDFAALLLAEGSSNVLVLVTKNNAASPDCFDLLSRARNAGYTRVTHAITDQFVIQQIYSSSDSNNSSNSSSDKEKEFYDLIANADNKAASDIHITASRDMEAAYIDFRIFGELNRILKTTGKNTKELCSAAYNAIAQSKEVTFNEKVTQDAQMPVSIGNKRFRLRYSHAPNFPDGFHAVLRILRVDDNDVPDLSALGFLPGQIKNFAISKAKPDGAILIAGTTGSGKSTTIRSLLTDMYDSAQGKISILTAEDPPEYVIKGAIQSPVVITDKEREEGKNPFEKIVRSMMRRDPDVIMIGEIRDVNTALSYIQAVQTGHIGVSTIHAKDAFTIPSRIVGLGAHVPENPLTLDAICDPGFVNAFISQKLAPVLCKHCSIPYHEYENKIDDGLKHRLNTTISLEDSDIRFRGEGCEHCHEENKGIKGLTVCAEIVMPDYEMLDLIKQGKTFEAYKAWRQHGADAGGSVAERMIGVTKLDVATYKMRQGLISPIDVESNFGLLNMQQILSDGKITATELLHLGN